MPERTLAVGEVLGEQGADLLDLVVTGDTCRLLGLPPGSTLADVRRLWDEADRTDGRGSNGLSRANNARGLK